MSDNDYWGDNRDYRGPPWANDSGPPRGASSNDRDMRDRRRADRADQSAPLFRDQESSSSETIDYAAFFRTIWRRKGTLACITVTGIVIATVVVMRLPPQYVAHAFIALGDSSPKNGLVGASNSTSAPPILLDPGAIQTEVEVLKSTQLARKVMADPRLQSDPEPSPGPSIRERFAAAAGQYFGPRIATLIYDPQAPVDPEADDDTKSSLATDAFLQRLRVAQKDTSRMIDVAFEGPDARLAMKTVNAIVDHYLSNQIELRSQMAQRNSDWLRDRIEQLQATVLESEKAVEQYRAKAGLFSTPGGAPLLLKEMTDVSSELAKAQTVRAALEAQLSQLRTNADANGHIPAGTDAAASPLLRALEAQEADAAQRLVEASATLGPKNPATIGINDRIRHIRSAIRDERRRMATGLDDDLKVARLKEKDLNDRLGRLQGEVARMNSAEITLHALERDAQADRLILNNFISQFKATSQQSDIASQRPDARIVSYAQLPVVPDKPKKGLLILICGIASLLVGVTAIQLLEKTDRTFRDMGELEKWLKIPVLGMIPVGEAARLAPSEAARYGTRYREAVKAAYVRLFWTRQTPKVTVVTSALPNEGKTTLALSLAAMAAQSGQRTLLIDADFWRKGASIALDMHVGAGLAELLEGKARIAGTVVTDIASGADILIPGKFSRGSLVSWVAALPRLLDSLKANYDIVIIDAPPLLSVSEATILTTHADATVLAVRWKCTPRDAALVALRKLQESGAIVAGAVLSMVHETQHARYGHSEGNYFLASLADYHPSTGAITRLPGACDGRRAALLPSTHAEDSRPKPGNDIARVRSLRSITGGTAPGSPTAPKSPSRGAIGMPASRYALIVVQVPEDDRMSTRGRSSQQNVHIRLVDTINRTTSSALAASVIVLREQKYSGTSKGHHIQFEEHPDKPALFRFAKPGSDAFSNRMLDQFLTERGIDHLFLAGMDGVDSIKKTARSALDMGYRVTFIRDAIFTNSDAKWAQLLKAFELEAVFAVTSQEFGEFTQALQRSKERSATRASAD